MIPYVQMKSIAGIKQPGRKQRARQKGLIPVDSGYQYNDDNHQDMVEYHFNAFDIFQDRMNNETKN